MEGSVGGCAVGDPEGDLIGAAGGDVDGVLGVLAHAVPADVVAAAGVGAGLDIDAVRGAVLTALVRGFGVMVGQTLAAVVVVFRLDGAGMAAAVPPYGVSVAPVVVPVVPPVVPPVDPEASPEE